MTMMKLEKMMGQKQRQHTTMVAAPTRTDRNVPREAYEYTDDVTPEGVALIRERTSEDLKHRKLRLIDGFRVVMNA